MGQDLTRFAPKNLSGLPQGRSTVEKEQPFDEAGCGPKAMIFISAPVLCLGCCTFNNPNRFIYILLIFLLANLGAAGIFYVRYLNFERKKKLIWQPLIEPGRLSLEAGDFFRGGASLRGGYRGYPLKLETVRKFYLHTRIRLRLDQRALESHSSEHPTTLFGKRVEVGDAASLLAAIDIWHDPKEPLKATVNVQEVGYEELGLAADVRYVEHLLEWLSDMAATYSALLALGGRAVPQLREIAVAPGHPLRYLAYQVLKDISRETSRRLGGQAGAVCPDCLVRYSLRRVSFPLNSIFYYGCRACGESQKFIEGHHVVAVLDKSMAAERAWQDGALQVNWLARRALFDFDEVRLVQASDEEVERFVIQVGNDPDPIRRSRSRQIPWFISTECRLSENTLRILQARFGQVSLGTPQPG